MIRPFRPVSAAALVMVLIFLVAITFVVLVVAANSIAERRASAVVHTTLNTELLVSTVENLVQAQIRSATTLSGSQAWVSQPGMIRVYAQDGSLATAYKLYSGPDIQVAGANFAVSLAKDIQLAANMDFINQPALYVDLNQPTIFQNNVHYPIADPRALGKVDGFLYNTSTNALTKNYYDTTGVPTPFPVIPMPVAWMYVLSDGQIIAPSPGTSGSGVALPGASTTNPVVGRIAFWVDDETCKLNVNTAADGSYWDTPRAGAFGNQPVSNPTQYEMQLAVDQPVQNEFQRYPGHPATTSLAPVLHTYLSQLDSSLSNTNTLREKLIALSSRYLPGGSIGGSVVTTGSVAVAALGTGTKNDPFYCSIDEYYFDPFRGVRAITGGTALSSVLEQTRFFLSASSRAPEVNLYNMPRVSLWPVSSTSGSNYRTVNDELNLFCSSLGTSGSNIYAFTRGDPTVVTGEMTGRNLALYNYIDKLLARPFPGFGLTSFAQKYPADSEQIVTEIVDFIRCTNLADQSMPNPSSFSPFTPALKLKSNAAQDIDLVNSRGTGQVVPMMVTTSSGTSRGFGRFPTISEAAIIVIGEKLAITNYQARAVLALKLTSVSQGPAVIIPNLQIQVEGLDGVQISLDGTNYNSIGFNSPVKYSQGEVGGYSLFGGTMGLAGQELSGTSVTVQMTSPSCFISSTFGNTTTANDFVDVRTKTFSFQATKNIVVKLLNTSGAQVQRFTFAFPSFTSNFPAPLLSASNNILTGAANTYLNSSNPLSQNSYQNPFYLSNDSTLNQRTKFGNFWEIFPINDDVVKSLVPLGPASGGGTSIQGDIRLVAAMADVPASVFVPNVNYGKLTNGGDSHSLSWNAGAFGRDISDGRFGRLVKDVYLDGGPTKPYDTGPRKVGENSALYDIPPAVNGVLNSLNKPGDFDTGISYLADGPWINKPDDGDIKTSAGRAPYFVGSQAQMTSSALFSPNRQVASGVQLGSLPTGVMAGHPWQTFLFCPNPAAVTTDTEAFSSAVHPGFGSPADHLLLDLFWMPVVEPWAISDPLSTSGKVNLNQQLLPFVNITRDTALRGVLKNVKIPAIPFSDASTYKWSWPSSPSDMSYRYDLDPDKTIAEIAKKWASNGVYLSASEICSVFLIPKAGTGNPVTIPANLTGANIISSFWYPNRLTGDNLRERPYDVIYPRLTTKSNVFTVHYTVQSLKKSPSSPSGSWDENRDVVLGEQRGAITLERYIDSKDPEFDDLSDYDFAALINSSAPPTLGRFYKFRTIDTRQFRP